jgi:translocator protein
MKILRQFFVIFTTIFALIMNGAANAIPLNGRHTGEISDSFKVIFVPAGYVFSIWGLIYLGLIAYTIYHSLPSQRTNPVLAKTGWIVSLSSIANGAWIYFWHYGYYAVTLLVMLILLACLLAIYQRLNIGRTRFSVREKWIVSIPFSNYLGWITVATIANATALLSYIGWNGWGISEIGWTLIMLGAAVVIAGLMSFTRSDIAFTLVLAWAFVGISVRWLNLSPVNIAGFASAAIVLLLLLLSRILPSSRNQRERILTSK